MLKSITGTKDILPEEIPRWDFLENLVKKIFRIYNYKEIRTPVFEDTSLFTRGIGETTDIVSKEMYTFVDRGGQSITLKPEMTAPVIRATIENSLEKKKNLNKLFYIAPMFRQERPQAGRFRQFHQFGAEAIGGNDPLLDAETIIIAERILRELGLKELEIKINSLGLPSSRESYKGLLKKFITPKFHLLSNDSKIRFEKNVLRIFDSKDKQDQEILTNAPLLLDHLDDESQQHFELVKKYLELAGVNAEIDPRLVRGLDYYTNTTFEILSSNVGSQSALCGGGRYNLLSEQLGGSYIPAVGFAAGIERILLACENEDCLHPDEDKIDLYIIRIDKNMNREVFQLGEKLRQKGFLVEFDYFTRSVKAQMREANKLNSRFVLFLGGDEYQEGKFTFKDMSSSKEEIISINEVTVLVDKLRGQNAAQES